MFVKVQDSKLIRDTNSMALINTDSVEKTEYYAKRNLLMNQKKELDSVKIELSELKNDMSEIKNLLQNLISKV